jgi:3-dehydroquinate synthase
MQKSFEIKSSLNSYQVSIGNNLVEDFLPRIKQNYIIICDEVLLRHYNFNHNSARIVNVAANEESKDLSRIGDVISKLKNYSLKRGDLLVGIGGGIIQDITCFISSIYMRGVNWVYFPTTFLGMCDSCIGGKSSINVNGIKNLVGNFYPPKEILIDLSFIKSLSQEQIDAGLCEAVKICYVYPDRKIFTQFCDIMSKDYREIFFEIVSLTLETKKWFIETDEFDLSERQLLNFGHTFGHCIEGAASYKIPHGIAVGFGMLWSICFSAQQNNLDKNFQNDVSRLETIILNIVKPYKNFCNIIKNLSIDDLLKKFSADKKHQGNMYVAILLNKDGLIYKEKLTRDQSFLQIFQESFTDLQSKI